MFLGYSNARKKIGHALARRPEKEFHSNNPLIEVFYAVCAGMPMVSHPCVPLILLIVTPCIRYTVHFV